MAPIQFLVDIVPQTLHHLVHRNDLDDRRDGQLHYSKRETLELQIIATMFSALTLFSAWLAFYWFLRMRRSFRHDLIMLLIQSDMFKALWFLVYPIAEFFNGPFATESRFCQANGFLISIGLEAADISVLLIAIHSALCILRPQSGSAEGLYPYRRIAYTIWIIVPILMASLAFLNPEVPYVSQGTFCYIPSKPYWWRLALSWAPRYIVLLTIIITYSWIYIYVRFKLRGFGSDRGRNSTSTQGSGNQRRQNSLPETPPAVYQGSPGFGDMTWDPAHQGRKVPASTADSWNTGGAIVAPESNKGYVRRSWPTNYISVSPNSTPETSERCHSDGRKDSQSSSNAPLLRGTPPTIAGIFDSPPAPSVHFPKGKRPNDHTTRLLSNDSHRSMTSPHIDGHNHKAQRTSLHSLFSFLHRGDDLAKAENSSPFHIELDGIDGESMPLNQMMRTREKMRKQLRYLFVYPLIYIGMWILPFISHVYEFQGSQSPLSKPFGSFALDLTTLICLTSQGAIDCWVFCSREKPWRHISGHDGSFLGSLRFWNSNLRFWKVWKALTKEIDTKGPGRTRAEMANDARQAYRRREQEIAAHREGRADASNTPPMNTQRQRSWRDEEDTFYFSAGGLRQYRGLSILEDEQDMISFPPNSPRQQLSEIGEFSPRNETNQFTEFSTHKTSTS